MAAIPVNERIKIWMRVLKAFICTFSGVDSNILSAEETVKEINKGKSLIRFGDGEFGIYAGKDIHYQKWNESLRNDFIRIKEEYESQGPNCPYILSVPKRYMQCTGMELGKKRVLVSSWSESRLFFKRHFNRDLRYGDSFLFEKKNKDIYSRIWKIDGDSRVIIFIHNNPEYAQRFRETYKRKVIFIKCPPQNAYFGIESIEKNIRKAISNESLTPSTCQIVISAGPAGKMIAFKLSDEGYQCIDAGHCWDDPLES